MENIPTKAGAASGMGTRSPIRAAGALSLMLAAVFLLSSCGGRGVQEEPNTSGGEPGASVDDINSSPEDLFGESVTVDGVVAQVLAPETFVIFPQEESREMTDAASGFLEDPELLAELGVLIVARDGAPNLSERQTVQVSGTVEEIDEGFAEEYGVPADNEVFAEFESEAGTATIIADSVKQVQGGTTSR